MRKNVKFCEDKKYANNINKSNSGISMVALVVTTIVHYVEWLNAVKSRVECI